VCDALLGLECHDAGFLKMIQKRMGMDWEQWSAAMRTHLGFPGPVKWLLINGGNRTGKSEYAAKRGQEQLTYYPGSKVFPLHMSMKRSLKEQQALFWKYMPTEWKIQKATEEEYIKYKQKTGFSDASFINPVKSDCTFLAYMQDKDTALEGMEADLVLPDELVPFDWIEALTYRLSTRSGKGIITFTPINGYTPTVQAFRDSAECTKESVAFMIPRDGGEPDPARTLGLTQAEYEELWEAESEKRAARAPQCRAEDCCAWLEGGSGQAEIPEGRKFAMVPRVEKPVNPDYAVVFFHCSDNPYGTPRNVVRDAVHDKDGVKAIKIRVYGDTDKASRSILTKFDKRIHVIKHDMIPNNGSNYMLMDPATDRNPFLNWMRTNSDNDWGYREWPGSYEIPGEGVPGPWAMPSGKKEGINDGKRGPSQESWGFGLLRLKFEMARLERWEAYLKWFKDEGQHMQGVVFPYPDEGELWDWDERDGAEEVIEQRYVDSRAASNPRQEKDRIVTLYEDLEEIGLDFELTKGSQIVDGIQRINDALDYDMTEDMSYLNHPRLLISDRCLNTIYACENWRNADGQKGACKEPIDNLRYFYTADCEEMAEGAYEPRGGSYYGRGSNSRRQQASAFKRPNVMRVGRI